MKFSLLIATLGLSAAVALACPRLAGDYFLNECPWLPNAQAPLRLHQLDCSALGLQFRTPDTSGRMVGTVRWILLSDTELLASEFAGGSTTVRTLMNDDSITLIEKLLPAGATVAQSTRTRFDQDAEGNLTLSRSSVTGAGESRFYVSKKNCPQVKPR